MTSVVVRYCEPEDRYFVYVNGMRETAAFADSSDADRFAKEKLNAEYEKMPKIAASEFCKFFEFSLQKEHGEFEGDVFDYIATDDQGVFETRHVVDVEYLADCFDSMLADYVDDTLESMGFSYTTSADEFDCLPAYYEQAQGWIETSCPELLNTDTYKVVCALVSNGKTIENDLV